MIVVRELFQLRFGMAREAIALWQEGIEFIRSVPGVKDIRLLTDFAGPYYTLVLESTHESLVGLDEEMRDVPGPPMARMVRSLLTAGRQWTPRTVQRCRQHRPITGHRTGSFASGGKPQLIRRNGRSCQS